MRVCHVVYSYVPFDPRVQREVSSLRLRGHEVDIVCLRDLGQPSVEDLEHVRIHRVPLRAIRGGMFRYAYQYATFFLLASLLLLRLQLRRRFNVVHVHSLPDFQIFCALPSKAFGASLILDMHEAMPEILAARFELSMNHPLAKVACALEALSGLIADRVLTVNSTIARLLEARGIDGRKLLVVMNSTDRPPSVSASPDDLLDRIALAGRTVIVYAGGVDPERDLETVVRAAAILSKSRPVSLLIFGKGPESYREELRGVVRNAPPMLDARIGDWIPPAKAVELVSLTDVGLVPYRRNPLTEIAMPNKVFEYAAAGKPMVVANLSTLRGLWESSALFYEPGDELDLARKMERIVSERDLAMRLVRSATAVYERHTWAHYEAELIHLYESLIQERRMGSSTFTS